jgi:hypothetical protein
MNKHFYVMQNCGWECKITPLKALHPAFQKKAASELKHIHKTIEN